MEVLKLKNELITATEKNLLFLEELNQLTLSDLNKKPAPNSWSILQCLEHLNRYGAFYLKEIDAVKIISKTSCDTFKPGYFGDKFTKTMLPEHSPIKPMKTFKSKNPNSTHLTLNVVEEFKRQQEDLLEQLDQFEFINLHKKAKTTLPIIKFKLGDTFRFVISHNTRHIQQAQRALQSIY
jgi:uncharacterized damage-inducible protein DinB